MLLAGALLLAGAHDCFEAVQSTTPLCHDQLHSQSAAIQFIPTIAICTDVCSSLWETMAAKCAGQIYLEQHLIPIFGREYPKAYEVAVYDQAELATVQKCMSELSAGDEGSLRKLRNSLVAVGRVADSAGECRNEARVLAPGRWSDCGWDCWHCHWRACGRKETHSPTEPHLDHRWYQLRKPL
jgi:hypothetical protein